MNSPHNPTGNILAPHHVEGIARFAEAHGLWIVSDEIYGKLVYDGFEQRSIVTVAPDLADRVVVTWPNGRVEDFANVAAGAAYTLTERRGLHRD